MKSSVRAICILAAIVIIIILIMAPLMGIFYLIYGPSTPEPFNRGKMESLIGQVRTKQFSGDKTFAWREDSGAPVIAVEDSPHTRKIYARRTLDGKLTVVIMTDWGNHVDNQVGFAYSETPPAKSKREDGLIHLDVPGVLDVPYLKKKIDEHWIEVYNPYAD